jgi:hypothetical protein
LLDRPSRCSVGPAFVQFRAFMKHLVAYCATVTLVLSLRQIVGVRSDFGAGP